MSNDKMREEFEAWHKTEVANFVAAGQMQAARVLSDFKQTAMAIWEVSRAAVVVELTAGYELPPTMDMQALVTSIRMQDIATIKAQGLRVKP